MTHETTTIRGALFFLIFVPNIKKTNKKLKGVIKKVQNVGNVLVIDKCRAVQNKPDPESKIIRPEKMKVF